MWCVTYARCQKEMHVQVSKLPAQGTICFYETRKSVDFHHEVFGESWPLSVFPCSHVIISYSTSVSISTCLSDYFSLHLFLCLDLSLCLCPLPLPFPFVEWFLCLSDTHKLAQDLILSIMIWCWAKYRHLLSLQSTQCGVPFFSSS